MADAYGGVA